MASSRLQTLILAATLVCGTFPTLAQQSGPFANGTFLPGYQEIICLNPVLAQDGGAAVVEKNGRRFFIAVGVTAVKGNEPAERVRQLRVAKINALRAVAEYIEPTKVQTETKLTEKTTVETTEKSKKGKSLKELDETTRTSVQATLQAPEQIGTWKSADGSLFFLAVGRALQ